jgi:hypothetical protein
MSLPWASRADACRVYQERAQPSDGYMADAIGPRDIRLRLARSKPPTRFYNQAMRSPCTLRFHIAAEAGCDIGGAIASLVAAGLLAIGAPLAACILLSLLGAPASFVLLRRYCGSEPRAKGVAVARLPGR